MLPATYLRHLTRAVGDFSPLLSARVHELGAERLLHHPHGDQAVWQQALAELPEVKAVLDASGSEIRLSSAELIPDENLLRQALLRLHPWRKGPFDIFDVHIDCEWRSDMKWQRLLPHLGSMAGQRVLDVGCGSGYHLWRMRAAGASFVLGIDPSILFLHQFLVIKRYQQQAPVWLAPLKMEEIPDGLGLFDRVFSMGVLYHRRDPMEHLAELWGALPSGGQLVLETLVVEGGVEKVLMPVDRYASMRNVWFLPSVSLLERWLYRCGFTDVACVDVNVTGPDEQRRTAWMHYQSLVDFLDPEDNTKTCEGYPAPRRAIVMARKP